MNKISVLGGVLLLPTFIVTLVRGDVFKADLSNIPKWIEAFRLPDSVAEFFVQTKILAFITTKTPYFSYSFSILGFLAFAAIHLLYFYLYNQTEGSKTDPGKTEQTPKYTWKQLAWHVIVAVLFVTVLNTKYLTLTVIFLIVVAVDFSRKYLLLRKNIWLKQ